MLTIRIMNKRLFLLTIGLVSAAFCFAQGTRRLTINGVFDLIEQNSTSLREQKTGIESAAEGVKDAKSQRLPDIGTQLSGSYLGNALMTDRSFGDAHGLHTPHWGNTLNIDVRQPIYAGGAIDAGIEMAKLGLESSKLSTSLNRSALRFNALTEYLNLEKIENRKRVLKANIELTQKLIDDIKARYSQGVALKNDVTRYELQMQQLRLALTKIDNQRAIINHQLCNTLGLPEGTTVEPADDVTLMTFPKDGEASWQQTATANSQQLQLSEVNASLAKQKEKIARSEMLPKVAIVANNNFNGPITFELPPIDKNLNIWYVGVGVTYQLSSLFKSNKKLCQAKLQSRQAQEQTAVAREQLNNAVQASYTEYLQSYVELETQQKNVQLARENYDVVNERYNNQLALITDMLDASNMRLDAELSEADAKIAVAEAYYKMKYISGEI